MKPLVKIAFLASATLLFITFFTVLASAGDISEIRERGVLRHLGIPYANFVTGSGDGMDVELVQLFSEHLGVRYQYVETSWKNAIGDLTGKEVVPKGTDIKILGDTPVRGDIIATGFTILPWRQKALIYSSPTFPTQIWLATRKDSDINPIKPGNSTKADIASVKNLIKNRSVLEIPDTCLDPDLYGLREVGAIIVPFHENLNELVPAILNRDAEISPLDSPDALIAMEKWPNKIKIIGPISPVQNMGYAFAKSSENLRDAFNEFLEQSKKNGTYIRLVKKYYPAVFNYYPEFFNEK
jgi:hypothetical protein